MASGGWVNFGGGFAFFGVMLGWGVVVGFFFFFFYIPMGFLKGYFSVCGGAFLFCWASIPPVALWPINLR